MTVGEIQDCLVLFGGNPSLGKVRLALLSAQVLQGQRAYKPLPTRIKPPTSLRWVAARQDEEQVLRKLGQEDLAHPSAQRRERLVSVDQNNLALRLGCQNLEGRILCIEAQNRPHGAHESVRRRLEITRVYIDRRGTRLVTEVHELAQQSSFSHTARAEDVQHIEG